MTNQGNVQNDLSTLLKKKIKLEAVLNSLEREILHAQIERDIIIPNRRKAAEKARLWYEEQAAKTRGLHGIVEGRIHPNSKEIFYHGLQLGAVSQLYGLNTKNMLNPWRASRCNPLKIKDFLTEAEAISYIYDGHVAEIAQ